MLRRYVSCCFVPAFGRRRVKKSLSFELGESLSSELGDFLLRSFPPACVHETGSTVVMCFLNRRSPPPSHCTALTSTGRSLSPNRAHSSSPSGRIALSGVCSISLHQHFLRINSPETLFVWSGSRPLCPVGARAARRGSRAGRPGGRSRRLFWANWERANPAV